MEILNKIDKLLDPGDLPCDCIDWSKGKWYMECSCRNSGDFVAAVSWMEKQSIYEKFEDLRNEEGI